jgi:murein DD-endopeptidase MepM/ murein hydrolase activator NlpD
MSSLVQELKKNQKNFHAVVPFDPATEKIFPLYLTKDNTELTENIYCDTKKFSAYLDEIKNANDAKFLIGGYNELREIYERSDLFNSENKYHKEKSKSPEPRRLHLGIDIWGDAGTPVTAPLGGMIHSFAFNNTFGDYGATIILQHQLSTLNFYTLYGHLSLADIEALRAGQFITCGQTFAHFGEPKENGNWPPHLHFQLIADIRNYHGDYPGVCKYSERKHYLENSPDPNIILSFSTKE